MRGIIAVTLYMLGFVLCLAAGLVVWAALTADQDPSRTAVTLLLFAAGTSAVAGEMLLRLGRSPDVNHG